MSPFRPKPEIIYIAVFAILVLGTAFLYFMDGTMLKLLGIVKSPLPQSQQDLYSGRYILNISTNKIDFPRFTDTVEFEPFEVSNGKSQEFLISAQDPEGIVSVKAVFLTDEGQMEKELSKIKEDNDISVWQGSWITQGVGLEDYYKVTFSAKSVSGKEEKIDIFFPRKK